MPFEIVRNDIVNMQVDAIVNPANPRPVIGSGCDAGIHKKAGPQLLEARKEFGVLQAGQVIVTPGFDLDAKYVLHAAGPVWEGGARGETLVLQRCYENALILAKRVGCESIAFPLLSAGNYGFPSAVSLQTAISVFSRFLLQNEMHIYLVVFNKEAFSLSEKLFQSVASYIDETYTLAKTLEEYSFDGVPDMAENPGDRLNNLLEKRRARRRRDYPPVKGPVCCAPAPMTAPAAPAMDLDKMLQQTDAGFSETLLHLIDRTGKKDSEIYKRANVDRKHFSKIRSNPAYKPSKATALAFAIALELDLDQTKDLIGRAGYALTHSSEFDIIVEYFILNRRYNIHEINLTLFRFDQNLLGA